MKYEEVSFEINLFLEKTNIKKYCQTICCGECCSDKKFSNCINFNCSERLPCLLFFCDELIEILEYVTNSEIFDLFYNYNACVITQPIRQFCKTENIFFSEYDNSINELDINIDKNFINYIKKDAIINLLKKVFTFLIKKKINIFDYKKQKLYRFKI